MSILNKRKEKIMEYSAIFHDMDKRFCYAIDKDLFVIRVQVKSKRQILRLPLNLTPLL